MARCSSCGAAIMWVIMRESGKANPLNLIPEKRIVITGQTVRGPKAEVVDSYISHFVTCPNAAQHRNKVSSND